MDKQTTHKFSQVLDVSAEVLDREKIFNGFIGIDSGLYLDPRLLKQTHVPELKGSYETFRKHFEKIIKILVKSKSSKDIFFRNAVKLLTFKEPGFLSLGYSSEGNSGRGIGPELARNLAVTAREIIEAGITDPEMFEIIGLLEENIGADRVSDMTARIMLPDLAKYSENQAAKLKLESQKVELNGIEYLLPINKRTRKSLILIPQEILNDLPIANDRSDIDEVVDHNSKLRSQINSMIGEEWKKASKSLRKSELKRLFIDNPDALRELIELYKASRTEPYDFAEDPLGEFNWLEIAQEYSKKYPLSIETNKAASPENILEIVFIICNHFKKLVEKNGLSIVFWDNHDQCKHERFAQRLFFGIAEAYCNANSLDLSPESDSGRGPVDFKLSSGKAKVNVEIKYTKNNNLNHAYETQLPIYNEAEGANHSILLVIRNTDQITAFENLKKRRQRDVESGKKVPEMIMVDGRIKPSASKS
jgi:hypothetical protein